MNNRGLPRNTKKRAVARGAGPSSLKSTSGQSVQRRRATVKQSRAVSENQLSELFVFGIALGSERGRPCLVLKDAGGNETLAVWLNPIDAAHAIEDVSHTATSAHNVTRQLLKTFGLRLDRCVFIEVRGHHQYARLHFSANGGGELPTPEIEVRADEAMSLCLSLSARFFASREFLARCRDVDAEMMDIENAVSAKPEMLSKTHRYMM